MAEVFAKAFFYVFWLPALAGLVWFRDRFRVVPGAWMLLLLCLVIGGLLYRVAADHGLLVRPSYHLNPPVRRRVGDGRPGRRGAAVGRGARPPQAPPRRAVVDGAGRYGPAGLLLAAVWPPWR